MKKKNRQKEEEKRENKVNKNEKEKICRSHIMVCSKILI